MNPIEFALIFWGANALLSCDAVAVDFCAIMSEANARKEA